MAVSNALIIFSLFPMHIKPSSIDACGCAVT
jgi:hypothetical protein